MLLICSCFSYADKPVPDLPDFYLQLKAQQQFSDSWDKSRFPDIRQWKAQARAIVRESLLWPDNPVPFNAELQQTEQRHGYRAERWQIQLTAESRVPVMLLIPDALAKPAPAILLLHDHGAFFDIGKEKMIRPLQGSSQLTIAQQWADKYFSGRFIGDELAAQGYLVVAADTFGWGERGPLQFTQQQALAANFLLLGRSLAGMAAYEDLRLTEFIRQLPQADSQRIGVLGFSMGAFKAWQLAALTDDIKATVAVAWMNTYQQLIVPGNNILTGQSAFYMLHPGLAARLDIPDVAAIAAPGAMMFINGAKDKLMPVAGAEQAYQKLRLIWQQYDAAEQLSTTLWPEYGHEFSLEQQQQAIEWLERQLKDASSK
ncbi:alpha/beta fold hydrolase [Chromatiaceae bacterium AAb-1]|nr:alpha/beta fold hydrolase [Chromatiaceae bacterium AAb-1]